MRKRKVLFFCLGAALVLAAVVWAVVRDREPSYDGRTLSEWADLALAGEVEASDGIRHIGTNSFPTVLEWLRFEPSPWKVKMLTKLEAGPPWVRPRFLVKWLNKNRINAYRAYQVLMIMGKEAAPIAPELFRLSYDKSDVVAMRALEALGYIGPTGLQFQLRAFRDPNHPHREWSFFKSPALQDSAP